ncbi:uncharacterized protein BXZ73DRAFT_98713 [Epithele typhae]|uniref:uncharacterized protein n=1 Tax=Epithele typhae TaxID=378194 RepID=UPI0020076D8B|nr:uncharacterized protein BXZ73DRAFT_98713 [Epithele typhae]KAH9940881.1 hypothetical protein BXZ73DRAFT_98713 [Epithele typhae]
MPPQPGVFAVSGHTTHKVRSGQTVEASSVTAIHYESVAGPSSRPHGGPGDDPKKEKRRKEVVGRVTNQLAERREDMARHFAEAISDLHSASLQLSTRPDTSPAYNLRLYPISLERGALLSSIEFQERHAMQVIQTAYEEERTKIEGEWAKGRDSIRDRMIDSIIERRKRAREEKDGEGTVIVAAAHNAEAAKQDRDVAPSTPVPAGHPGAGNGSNAANAGAVTTGPLLNPHSLNVEELPSPFPLPLIVIGSNGGQSYGYSANAGATGNGRRRAKNKGEKEANGVGKNLACLIPLKEADYEADLGEIRRGNKRRRAAVFAMKVHRQGRWLRLLCCYSKWREDKVHLFLVDGIGIQSPNNQLLADDFALNGFKTVIVDYYEGEPVPLEVLTDPELAGKFDLPGWLGRHPPTRAQEIVRAVMAALREEGVAKFASTGYCYGGGSASTSLPGRPLEIRELSRAPLLLNSCEFDEMFPQAEAEKADDILGGGKFAPGYERTHWEGCHHGYAVRGDMTDPKVTAGKEGAFNATVKFLKKYFV